MKTDVVVKCPYCESPQVTREGKEWNCACCAKSWAALSELDKKFLRKHRILVDEP